MLSLILAKADRLGDQQIAAQWILDKPATALRTKIKAKLLAYLFADLRVVEVIDMLEEIVHLFELVAFVVDVEMLTVHRCVDFNTNHITQVCFSVEFTFAHVTRVSNHGPFLPDRRLINRRPTTR